MSQTTYRISTTVLPGSRIEVTAPGMKEGDPVDVILVVPEAHQERHSMSEFIRSLPQGPRSAATWDEIEKNLQEERDSWDS